MMMKRIVKQAKNKKIAITAVAIMAASIGLGGFYLLAQDAKSEAQGIKFSNLQSGTKVKYRVLSGNELIAEKEEKVAADNTITLPLPKEAEDKEDIKFSMRLSNEQASQKLNPLQDTTQNGSAQDALDMIVQLNTKKDGQKKLGFAVSGLDEFSDITIKKGEQSEKLSADWSGLFQGELDARMPQDLGGGVEMPDIDENIELAFQKFGIESDATGGPKMEVFLFGGGGGASIGDVRSRWTRSLFQMTEELSAVMVLQTFMIGSFFDASIQLDTQRKLQELMARAHKDYHPSEQMCRIGTFVRGLSSAESHGELVKASFNRMLMNAYLGTSNSSAASGPQVDESSRVRNYIQSYCDPNDVGQSVFGVCPATGGAAEDLERRNKDVDYHRTFGGELTLDVDMVQDVGTLSPDEEDLFALARNLYFPNVFSSFPAEQAEEKLEPHYDSRSFASKMNVAHSSFISILGMKTAAAPRQTDGTGAPITSDAQRLAVEAGAGWNFMKSLIREFGTFTDDQIHDMLGDRPSYYAQMEVLTKKLYQHPNFYTNLYDKPANVDRIGASLDAIAIMHQRDRYESMLRREMLTALLVEEALNSGPVERVSADIYEAIQQPPVNE